MLSIIMFSSNSYACFIFLPRFSPFPIPLNSGNGIFDGEIAINSLYKFREDIPEKSEDNGSEMMIREDGYYEHECGKVLGHLVPTGNGLIHKQKLMAANIRIEELDK